MSRVLAALPAAVGLALGLAALVSATSASGSPAAALDSQPSMQAQTAYRIIAPAIGCDSCGATNLPAATAIATPKTSTSTQTATATPTSQPYALTSWSFCRIPGCPSGAQPLRTNDWVHSTFHLNRLPTELVSAQTFWNGSLYGSYSWPQPYTLAGFGFSEAIAFPSTPGTIEIRVSVGGKVVGTFNAIVAPGTPTATATATSTPTPTVYTVTQYAFCRTSPTCQFGSEVLFAGQIVRVSFHLSGIPAGQVTADAYWDGTHYNSFTWELPNTASGFYVTDPALGYPTGPGKVELRIKVAGVLVGTISATVTGPSATATPTPTPTLYIPPGGGFGCIARRTTSDWDLCVRDAAFDLFEIRVTALSEAALDDFSFRVRVYAPGDFLGSDSSSKYPFYVGQTWTLSYGFDFFKYGPYARGLYEIELRAGFLKESSVFVYVN